MSCEQAIGGNIMKLFVKSAAFAAMLFAFASFSATAADFPADPGCRDPLSELENPQCDDDLDNDDDGTADFPADPGCDDASDGSERSPALVGREHARHAAAHNGVVACRLQEGRTQCRRLNARGAEERRHAMEGRGVHAASR